MNSSITIKLSQVKHGKLIVDKWMQDQVWVSFSNPNGSNYFELTQGEAFEFIAAITKTLEANNGK